mmetsp:Transcript_14395/g.38543  ORF Transcript_14395/g.38543 Transcript_14395/m.38543 type:complete len:163 (-) Transcript_14395:825-1313(-)
MCVGARLEVTFEWRTWNREEPSLIDETKNQALRLGCVEQNHADQRWRHDKFSEPGLRAELQVHGATYTVDCEFHCEQLEPKLNWVVDIGEALSALSVRSNSKPALPCFLNSCKFSHCAVTGRRVFGNLIVFAKHVILALWINADRAFEKCVGSIESIQLQKP